MASVSFATVILTGYFRTIPRDVIDAARVDGAGRIDVLLRIVIPLARPGILAVAVLVAVFTWNDFGGALVLLQRPDAFTAQLALSRFSTFYATDQGLTFAGMAIVILPPLLLFLVAPAQLHPGPDRRCRAPLTDGVSRHVTRRDRGRTAVVPTGSSTTEISDAPADRQHPGVADRRAEQEAAHGLDQRRERLVLGEPARPSGIDSVGTKPLLRNGRRTRNIGQVARGLDAVRRPARGRPPARRSRTAASTSTPVAAAHSSGPVVDRKPITTATTMTITMASIVWMTLPTTWPVRTDARAIAMVRNRATIPSVMSIAIEIAVPWAAPATVIRRIARDDVREVVGATAGDGAEAGPERAAEDVDEQQQEHDRDAGDEERQRRVAAHPAEVSPEHRRRVGEDERGCGHGTVTFCASWSPVSDRKTSSRSGVCSDSASTSIDPASSRSRRARSEPIPPSLGIWRVSDSSSRAAPSNARAARSSCADVGERQPDVAARHEPLELVGCALRDQHAAVEHADPVGQPVRLLQVLRREEDRHAVRDEALDRLPHARRLRGSSPAVGSSRKMIRGSPTRVMARSRRRRMPPE